MENITYCGGGVGETIGKTRELLTKAHFINYSFEPQI